MPKKIKQTEIVNEYNHRINQVLRNYTHAYGDFNEDGFLTEEFFENSNISPMKKSILRDLTKMFKEKLIRLNMD